MGKSHLHKRHVSKIRPSKQKVKKVKRKKKSPEKIAVDKDHKQLLKAMEKIIKDNKDSRMETREFNKMVKDQDTIMDQISKLQSQKFSDYYLDGFHKAYDSHPSSPTEKSSYTVVLPFGQSITVKAKNSRSHSKNKRSSSNSNKKAFSSKSISNSTSSRPSSKGGSSSKSKSKSRSSSKSKSRSSSKSKSRSSSKSKSRSSSNSKSRSKSKSKSRSKSRSQSSSKSRSKPSNSTSNSTSYSISMPSYNAPQFPPNQPNQPMLSHPFRGIDSVASRNFANELHDMRNSNQYNESQPSCVITKNRKKPKCKIKKSVTLIRKPNHKGRIISLKKVCHSGGK